MTIAVLRIVIYLTVFLLYNSVLAQNFFNDKGQKLQEDLFISYDTLIMLSKSFSFDAPDSAIYYATEAHKIAHNENSKSKIGESSYWMAEALTNASRFKEAIDYYGISAEQEFRLIGDSTVYLAERLSDMAFCYQELGLYEKSLELNEAALRIQKKFNNPEEIGNVQSNIGTNYFFLGKYDKALGYFEATLAIDKQRNDSSAVSTTLNNIGMLYSRWGKMPEAIEFYEESLKYIDNESKKAIRFSNIGTCYFHLNQPEKALEYLNESLEIDLKRGNHVKVGIRKNEIANVLSGMGEQKKAIALQKEALVIFRQFDISESEAIALNDLGETYKKMALYDSAEICFKKSVEIAGEIKAIHHLIRNYKSLYELAEAKAEYRKALNYYKLFTSLNDSVYSNEKHEQLARFEILYDTEKKEKENQLLTKDLQISRKIQNLSTAIIISLALISVLLYYLFRIRSKSLQQSKILLFQEKELLKFEHVRAETDRKMLEDRIFAEQQINRLEREKYLAEIKHKNRELANATLCLVNKNEILVEIRDKIKAQKTEETMSEVVRYINSNTDTDLNWNKFRLEFNKIHPGFSDRLRSRYPDLTDHDYRLCTYLRIDLSSREISGMMSISLDAVNKQRQRLRKKLGLEPESDLTQFFESI